ncbi:MAG: M24 family metallopeptidase [Enterobacterales bacterium]|nr:M24 family metallopeptidase [Enterobacterales bacterium]
MSIQYRSFSQQQLKLFKQYQQKSYQTLEEARSMLQVGDSEIKIARRLRKLFHQQGVHSYFHVPVVLFGKRTGYPGDFGAFEALATEHKLEKGMPVILDAAPIYDGYIVDTSLSFSFGDDEPYQAMYHQLKSFRKMILAMVKKGESFQIIEQAVNQKMQDIGAVNCHRKHIGEVLGHRIFNESRQFWRKITYKQLSLKHVLWLVWKSLATKKGWIFDSPNWNHRRTSDRPPAEGLWAVEPHFCIDGIGVKFEEILVIEKDNAYWLDDELPHSRTWEAYELGVK